MVAPVTGGQCGTPGAQDMTTDQALSHRQIAELTLAYCRGVDRADEALLKSIFHDDSIVICGAFEGNGQQFASEICTIVRAVFDQTLHSIDHQSIEVTGDTAMGETYVVAVSTMTDLDRGKSEMLTGGRYLDRFTRRDGIWKFAARTFVSEWSRIDGTSCTDDAPSATQGLGSHPAARWH
ncbi:nuclear transport factor 2 family protein [Sphingobium sp. Z007]|uniref:nuclear transport factor 2 family protein n=1 Tax=Sphingobium sp. Z007 TaxID=627495 RepID=UPI001595BF36|nr:nuclear transport factor 2 family protein [Sphingobium sp. Z007]